MKDTRIVPDSSQYQLWRDDKHVATVYDHDDARLFNAASDLLAACEGAVDKCRFGCTWLSYCGTCKSLLAAIAKAKGETK